MSPADIERYLKLWAHATRGVDGERANAQRMMEAMERKFPGIRGLAEAVRGGAQSGTTNAPPPAGLDMGAWDVLRTFARTAFGMFEGSASVSAGATAARRVKPHFGIGEDERGREQAFVGVTFGKLTLDRLSELDELEQEGFKERAVAVFREALAEFIDDLEEEDDD